MQQRESLDRKLCLKEKIEKALTTNLSKRQRSEEEDPTKVLEEEMIELRKMQKISFNLIHKEWPAQGFGSKHPVVTKMLEYAALIPPSTAEPASVWDRTYYLPQHYGPLWKMAQSCKQGSKAHS